MQLHCISKPYQMDIYHDCIPLFKSPSTDIVAHVFKYVRWKHCLVYGIYFLMWFIQSIVLPLKHVQCSWIRLNVGVSFFNILCTCLQNCVNVSPLVMTHPWVVDKSYVKYYSDPRWQWGVMAQTLILGMCALWPCHWRYDLRSRSWQTLWSWATKCEILSDKWVRSYGLDMMWTDWRTGWFLYTPKLFLQGV